MAKRYMLAMRRGLPLMLENVAGGYVENSDYDAAQARIR